MVHEADIGSLQDLVRYRLEVAMEDLQDAKDNFALGKYRTANNRAYYSAFRAVQVCLTLEGKAFKSHAQVLGCFNKDYVRTGIFPPETGRELSLLQEVRHSSDYNDFYVVSKEETKRQIEIAEKIVKLINEYAGRKSLES